MSCCQVRELQHQELSWAGHVRQLVDASQQANLPWSRSTERLVSAAKSGCGLEEEVGDEGVESVTG